MMDIEKMKRVNALARELKDHGIAMDYEEAYRQAEKMIESGLDSGDIKTDDISVKPYVPKEEAKQSPGMGFDALELKSLKGRLENLEQQLNVLFLKMNEIISEINKFEKKKADSPIELRPHEEKQNDMQANLKSQPTEAHPRTGDYKSSDVAIEKMFYFGGARQ